MKLCYTFLLNIEEEECFVFFFICMLSTNDFQRNINNDNKVKIHFIIDTYYSMHGF